MAVLKCKMCGGDLQIGENGAVAQCEYCGTMQTVPRCDNDKKITQFARANRLRLNCEFDKAFGVYESIVAEYPEEAEAYWGLVLCKFGIEYVDDPATGKKIPTCHRSSFTSLLDDTDYEQTLENADASARKLYRDEAKQIEDIRKGILEVSATEEAYDVFICYKETDAKGQRTLDSVLAQDIYDALTEKNYRVFFSRVTLEQKLGQEYEPYIFAALNSAKVMLSIGTDYEHFNAVWVRNEWSRYLKLMETDKSKHLIPCFRGIDAYDMPREFAKFQAQDLGKVGAVQDLLRGIEKLITATKPAKQALSVDVVPHLAKGDQALREKDWKRAINSFNLALVADSECAEAYLGKFMAERKIRKREKLGKVRRLGKRKTFDECLKYAKGPLKEELNGYLKKSRIASIAHIIRIVFVLCLLVLAGQIALNKTYAWMTQELYANPSIQLAQGMEKLGWYKQADSTTQFLLDWVAHGDYDENMTTVVIPDGITCVGNGVFKDCYTIQNVEIPISVTKIGDSAFAGCTRLESVTIPDSVTTIGSSAFAGCTRLESVTIPDSVTTIGSSAFAGCDGLKAIEIPNSVTQIGNSAFASCRWLRTLNIANGVKTIDKSAFAGCTRLESVTIPDSVTTIGSSAFAECGSLSHLEIGNGVTSIGSSAFARTSIKTVVIPDSVTTFGKSVFSGCVVLNTVTIGNGVTKIDEYAFYKCYQLESVELGKNVAAIGSYAFSDCKRLNHFELGNGVTTIGSSAFARTSIKTVVIPDSVTQIDESAFCQCYQLESVEFGKNVAAIGTYAFRECKKLKSVNLPDSVISIGDSAFWDCEGLAYVSIPASVTAMGAGIFVGCKGVIHCAVDNEPDSWKEHRWSYNFHGDIIWGSEGE